MQGDEQEQRRNPDDDGQFVVEHLVHKVRDNDCLDRSEPEIMQKYNANVEAIDVVGQQIYRLADRRLAQSGPRQPQRLPIDKRATGDTNLHAHVQDRHHVRVDDEHVDRGAQDNANGIQIRLRLVNIRGAVVAQQLAQKYRL